jgi:hypothetical protein
MRHRKFILPEIDQFVVFAEPHEHINRFVPDETFLDDQWLVVAGIIRPDDALQQLQHFIFNLRPHAIFMRFRKSLNRGLDPEEKVVGFLEDGEVVEHCYYDNRNKTSSKLYKCILKVNF